MKFYKSSIDGSIREVIPYLRAAYFEDPENKKKKKSKMKLPQADSLDEYD